MSVSLSTCTNTVTIATNRDSNKQHRHWDSLFKLHVNTAGRKVAFQS